MAATIKSRFKRWTNGPAVLLAATTLGCQSPIPNFGGSTLESATRVPPPPTGSYAVPGSYDASQRIGDAAPRGGDVGQRISDAGSISHSQAMGGSGAPAPGVVPASAEQPSWRLPGQP